MFHVYLQLDKEFSKRKSNVPVASMIRAKKQKVLSPHLEISNALRPKKPHLIDEQIEIDKNKNMDGPSKKIRIQPARKKI